MRDNNSTLQLKRCGRLGLAVLAAGLGMMAAGCTQPVTIDPNTRLLDRPGPHAYSDQDWAAVLRDCVRDGLVNYAGLAAGREPLDRYYALLGETGPSRTPDQFRSAAHATAYWINAYNAAVLLFVLEHFPAETIYDENTPKIEAATFRVNGQVYTLPQMESKILQVSGGDVRALFATSRGALGTPRLPAEPIRAATLEPQIARAAADALNNPRILRIDQAGQQVLVWQVVLAHRDDFERYYCARHRAAKPPLLSVLMVMASAERRGALGVAAGYPLRTMPFGWQLNNCATGAAVGERPLVP